jgi:hypothetical protein
MIKRHNPKEAQALWAWVQKRPNKWWQSGTKFSSSFGWPQIFESDNWHCIYCVCDLAHSEDALAESTEEHLVPQALFSLGGLSADIGDNVAAACATCNSLKSSAAPVINDPAWASRAAYIAAMRIYIGDERIRRAIQYRTHILKVRAKRIWSATNVRQKDYL